MQPQLLEFDILEYLVFGLMLGVSALIGVYFGFIKGGQDTVDGYLLGGKQMGLFPISMSLISSFISGITILGMPTEIYTHGTQYMAGALCYIPVCLVSAFVFLPVFYKLQLISVYQYMEMRFNRKARLMVSLLFTVSLIMYIPIVILGPALALNQVSGLNIRGTSILVCAVCIFYTTFGGLKAVVWTDTIQAVVMIASCIFVAVLGITRVGGLSAVFEAAQEGGRLEFNNFDPNPFQRTTFWSIVVGLTFSWSSGGSAISPSAVQRYVSLNTLTKAQWSVFICCVGCFIFFFLSCFMGLVIYAEYKSCDPLASGMIKSADQILPYFIMDVAGSYRGIPGLFLAGVVSAALSTMATGMNTVSGTIYEDFLERALGKTTERRASNIMKLLSAVFGIVCLLLVMIMEDLGSLIELSNAVGNLTSGSILGMFIMGMFIPHTTSLGAIVGGLSSMGLMSWIVVGSRYAIVNGDLVYDVKPVSVDGCGFNITNLNLPEPATSDGVFPLYQLSIFYFVTFGCITTIIVGVITSFITGPNDIEKVDRSLLSPIIYRLLPAYKPVPLKETELDHIKA